MSSLLKYTVSELVHTVYLNSNLLGVRKAYFCGNFVNHDVIRQKVTAQFTVKNSSRSVKILFFINLIIISDKNHLDIFLN